MLAAIDILKALADPTRLRILGVLSGEPLGVNEIQDILELRQSRISRHLSILAAAGLVRGQRNGARVYYDLAIREGTPSALLLHALALGDPVQEPGDAPLLLPPELAQDRRRMRAFLKRRQRDSLDHFQHFGPDQESAQRGLVDSEFYRTQVLGLVPDAAESVLDLGCGTGELASGLALRAEQLICVDQSANMLKIARRSVTASNVEFRLGSFDHLPLRDGEVQVAIASMVLHHMPEPARALSEICRVLGPGGRLIVAELDRHREEVMRTRFADFWLGFPSRRLRQILEEQGFEVHHQSAGRGAGSLRCLFVLAHKPGSLAAPGAVSRRLAAAT